MAWDPEPSPPAAGYKVYYGPAAGNYSSQIDVGNVTAYTGKVELGHGLYTSQTQLIAEELCVPLARVKLIVRGATPCRAAAWAITVRMRL